MSKLTEDRFLRDVADHVMETIHEDGLHRHIRFRKPGTMCMHFDLITWPGYLCYTGDMGTYVFYRLQDMFEFFRTDRAPAQRKGKQLGVNLGYWAEKLVGVDGNSRNGAAEEYSEEKLRRVINDYRLRWIREARSEGILDKEQRRELWEAVDDEVLSHTDDGEQAVYIAARDFHWPPRYCNRNEKSWYFDDLWEHNFTDYTHRFRWCCFALAWGIEKYDDVRAALKTSTGE